MSRPPHDARRTGPAAATSLLSTTRGPAPRAPHQGRRRHPRSAAGHEGGLLAYTVRFELLDLCPRGIGIQTRHGLRVGERVTVRSTAGRQPFSTGGRVAWCRLTHTRRAPNGELEAVYRAGLTLATPWPATACDPRGTSGTSKDRPRPKR